MLPLPLAVEIARMMFRLLVRTYREHKVGFDDNLKKKILGTIKSRLDHLEQTLGDESTSRSSLALEEQLETILAPEIVWAEEYSPVMHKLTDEELFERWSERTGGTRKMLAEKLGVGLTTIGRLLKGKGGKTIQAQFRDLMERDEIKGNRAGS